MGCHPTASPLGASDLTQTRTAILIPTVILSPRGLKNTPLPELQLRHPDAVGLGTPWLGDARRCQCTPQSGDHGMSCLLSPRGVSPSRAQICFVLAQRDVYLEDRSFPHHSPSTGAGSGQGEQSMSLKPRGRMYHGLPGKQAIRWESQRQRVEAEGSQILPRP